MEDDLKKFENGRRPQFFEKGRRPKKMKMDGDLNFQKMEDKQPKTI